MAKTEEVINTRLPRPLSWSHNMLPVDGRDDDAAAPLPLERAPFKTYCRSKIEL